MRDLAIAAYSLTGSVYLLFILWLVFQGKTKETSQRYFIIWLGLLFALAVDSTILTAIREAANAWIVVRIHLSFLILSGVSLWFFGTSLLREISEWDILDAVPALITIPFIWTILTSGVKENPFGWQTMYGPIFILFVVVLYGYYVGTLVQLYRVYVQVKRAGSEAAARGIGILLVSVAFLTAMGLLNAVGRMTNLPYITVLVSLSYVLPAAFMAYTFKLGK